MRTADPAQLKVGTAFNMAVRFTLHTAPRWMPVALIGVLAGLLMRLIVTNLGFEIDAIPPTVPSDAQITALGEAIFDHLPELLALGALSIVSQLLLGWVAVALTIAALRGREERRLTAGDVVWPGLGTIGAGLLLAFALLIVIVSLLIVFMLVDSLDGDRTLSIGVALLGGGAALIGVIYVSVRLTMVSLAIFDGATVREAFALSWRLAGDGAWWRIVGWIMLAGLAVGVLAAAADLLISMAGPIAVSALQPVVTATGVVFSTALLGLLYESQRARHGLSVTPVDPSSTEIFPPSK